jgi:gamma-glutamyl AIG2-like cyclotransferase
MPLLFSYGAFGDDGLRDGVVGRSIKGEPDQLLRFELSDVEVEGPRGLHYPNLMYSGRNDSRVKGMVFNVSESELAAADKFATSAGYKRQPEELASGRLAWVYVHAG